MLGRWLTQFKEARFAARVRSGMVMSKALAQLAYSAGEELVRGHGSDRAIHALVTLHTESRGRATHALGRLVRRRRPPRPIQGNGLVGAPKDAHRHGDELRERGLTRFEQKLPKHVLDELMDIAVTNEGVLRDGPPNGPTRALWNGQAPIAALYTIPEDVLVAKPSVQRLMADPSLLAVAQDYLGCAPILDNVSLWWSSHGRPASGEAAQLFHFDMDRISWLKFFVHITDVDEMSGPHVFVEGSHRPGAVPASILSKGYARLDDSEILRHFPAESVRAVIGEAGAIFAEDSRGLHKGLPPITKPRLMLQMEYVSSLVGAKYARPRIGALIPELAAMSGAHPQLLCKYRL